MSEGVTVAVRGLRELQRDLRQADRKLAGDLRGQLRAVGDHVRDEARGNVRSRSGRLAASLRTSATQKGVSVYSGLVYSRVQDEGGRVGRRHATLLRRSDVSQYMTRATAGIGPRTTRAAEEALDAFERAVQA